MDWSKVNKLAFLLGNGGVNGTIAVAAAGGLFRLENAFSIAVIFLAGPASIITAAFLEGSVHDRMMAAVMAGAIATIIVALSAGVGPALLQFTNIGLVKMFAGAALGAISLMMVGISIPESVPTIIMAIGILAGMVAR